MKVKLTLKLMILKKENEQELKQFVASTRKG